jgi:hypothetical protein
MVPPTRQRAHGRRRTKTDLTHYPAREGFEDLVMLHHKDADDFAWAAVVFPEKKFVWFSLKNPAHLASTVLWHSNGGRHYAPWNGRHRGVLGIEDVTAYFHLGLAASLADNPWKEKGVPTALALGRKKSTRIPYIMGVAPLPDGFDIRQHHPARRPPASASQPRAARTSITPSTPPSSDNQPSSKSRP